LQEAVGDSLVELWISYNQIEKLKGINVLKKLKVRRLWFCTLFKINCRLHAGELRAENNIKHAAQ